MRYLCLDEGSSEFAIGKTLTEAYDNYLTEIGTGRDLDELSFYEISDKALEVEMQITKKQTVVKK